MLAEKSLRFEFCQVTENSELDFPILSMTALWSV